MPLTHTCIYDVFNVSLYNLVYVLAISYRSTFYLVVYVDMQLRFGFTIISSLYDMSNFLGSKFSIFKY